MTVCLMIVMAIAAFGRSMHACFFFIAHIALVCFCFMIFRINAAFGNVLASQISMSELLTFCALHIGWSCRNGRQMEVRRFGADGSSFSLQYRSDGSDQKQKMNFQCLIGLTYCLIRFDVIGSKAKIQSLDWIGFSFFESFVGSEIKNCFRSDPTATLIA